MRPIGCDTVRDRLPDLEAGCLDASGSAALKEHLASCEACRAEAEVVGLVRRNPAPVPAGLEARVLEALASRPDPAAAAPSATPAWGRRLRWRPSGWAPVPVALAATVAGALLAGALLLRGGADRGGVEGATARAEAPADPLAAEPAGTDTAAGLGAAAVPAEELASAFPSWPASDGVVAGAVVLEDLSVEELELLLSELES